LFSKPIGHFGLAVIGRCDERQDAGLFGFVYLFATAIAFIS
jgi:hypothetical protein